MVEFFKSADIFPDPYSAYGNTPYDSINEYLCDRCEQPMIRFDNFRIERVRDYDNQKKIVHAACSICD